MDSEMREFKCRFIQVDEIWGFVGKKQGWVREDDDPRGVRGSLSVTTPFSEST